MALESGTYVKDLVSTNPPGTDAISQGDDHLRLIKSVLQNSFPSNSNAPIIPDVSGNEGKYLQVNSGATATQWGTIRNRGYINRAQFDYSSSSAILIGSGAYEVDNGSAPETFYWDSQLTFTLGSGGSNASSSALGTSQWQYIYMDESAISASPLVASSFLNSTTAPTYSQSKHGWYNGSDRCIFAVHIDGSGNIERWYHDGGNHVEYMDDVQDGIVYSTGAWATVTLTMPVFAKFAEASFLIRTPEQVTDSTAFFVRVPNEGSGHIIGVGEAGAELQDDSHVSGNKRVATNSSQQIEIQGDDADPTTTSCTVYANGFFLPKGI